MPTKTPPTKWAIEEIIEKLRNAGLPKAYQILYCTDSFSFEFELSEGNYSLNKSYSGGFYIHELYTKPKNWTPCKDLDQAISKLQEIAFGGMDE